MMIGRQVTKKAREVLGLGEEQIFIKPNQPKELGGGYTLAQRWSARLVARLV